MTRRRITVAALVLLLAVVGASVGTAPAAAQVRTPVNIPVVTLGGMQFWADVRLQEGWRIQRNSITGHYRLLDDDNIRRAWGSFADAMAAMDTIAPAPGDPTGRHLVMLIPGALRSPHSFAAMGQELEEAGYQVAAITYDSSRRGFDDHVGDLAGLLGDLEGYDQISFVTHSMGGLIVRALLSEKSEWRGRIAVVAVVQIAPPNQGSAAAEVMRDTPIFRLLYGSAGKVLRHDAARALPLLDPPVAVIAGGTGTADGHNPLIPGDDDGVLAVAETRLQGAHDFLVVDALHSFILDHPATIAAVLNFLETGRLKSPATPPLAR